MKCVILHESSSRIRIHVCKRTMSFNEADKLEIFLSELPYIKRANVNERTCDAVIIYKNDVYRDKLIKALSHFSFEKTEVNVIENDGRSIRHEYEEKMFFTLVRRGVMRMLAPVSIRHVITFFRTIPYIYEGVKCLANGKLEVSVLDATSIAVSMLRGDLNTTGSIMFLLKIGEIMDEWTRKKSVSDLAKAMSLNIEKVWKLTEDGTEVLTNIDEISIDDVYAVRTGNMIPLDGIVVEGEATVNQASITGEGIPANKHKGAYVYAGTVIESGELCISVKNAYGAGQYDRITRMIEESEKLKSETEDRAFHMADKMVPYTFAATLLTYILTGNLTRATSILMVDFCCAMRLSIPIAVLSAMREAGENKITVKGGKLLEKVAQADTIIFDKTGTLTRATPRVVDIVTFGELDKDESLRLAACLEEHYPHSMANAVVTAAKEKNLEHEEKHTKVEYVVAHGIVSSIDGKKVLIGSKHFVMEDEGCIIPEEYRDLYHSLPRNSSHLYLALDGKVIAIIMIEDPLKDEAEEVIRELKKCGFKKIVMLTGDSDRIAKKVATKLGVDDYKSQVLPEDKALYIDNEHKEGRTVMMIGDGINDSPALSKADVGVAINSGAAIARSVADITIGQDDLHSLIILKKLSEKLQDRTKLRYNEIIGFNGVLILLGALGILQPTMTAILHNSSTVFFSARSTTNLLKD